MDQVTVSRSIGMGRRALADLFWDIGAWQRIWNPIEEVVVTYDDGEHQEFVMRVMRDEAEEVVRTVRFRDGTSSISFFSPVPPPMMTRHSGAWVFADAGHRCRVNALRTYEITHRVGEGPSEYDLRCRSFHEAFAARLQAILDRLASHCAARA